MRRREKKWKPEWRPPCVSEEVGKWGREEGWASRCGSKARERNEGLLEKKMGENLEGKKNRVAGQRELGEREKNGWVRVGGGEKEERGERKNKIIK